MNDADIVDAAADVDRRKKRDNMRRWRFKNRDEYNAYMRAWRAKNPEKAKAYRQRWQKENADKARESSRRHSAAVHATPDGFRRKLVQKAKSRANQAGMAFDLDWTKIHWPEVCPVLGMPLVYCRTGGRQDDSPSLDRIDSSGGYTLDNVHIISLRANRIKNDATVAELRRLADYMELFHG